MSFQTALARLLLPLSLSLALPSPAASPLDKGFDHFYNLEYDEAVAEFEARLAESPQSPDRYNALANAILYREMLRAGALESELVTGGNAFLRRKTANPSPETHHRFDTATARAIQLADEQLMKRPDDPAALYAKAVALGLRGNYNFLVRKAWMDALREFTQGRKLANRVVELQPAFIDARLMQGVHDYVLGSLPFHYKLLGFLGGFRGDKASGITTLKLVAEKGGRNRTEAQIVLGLAYRRDKRPREAVPLLLDLIGRHPRNYIYRLELAQIYADAGEPGQAVKVLDELDRLTAAAQPGFTRLIPEKIAYARGNLHFWYNDTDKAITSLRRATAASDKLDLNTGVLAWMRLGQAYDMKGQRRDAVDAYRRAVDFAPGSEPAKESSRYISSPYKRRS